MKMEWVLWGLESTTAAARVSSNPQGIGASQKRSSLPKKDRSLGLSFFSIIMIYGLKVHTTRSAGLNPAQQAFYNNNYFTTTTLREW